MCGKDLEFIRCRNKYLEVSDNDPGLIKKPLDEMTDFGDRHWEPAITGHYQVVHNGLLLDLGQGPPGPSDLREPAFLHRQLELVPERRLRHPKGLRSFALGQCPILKSFYGEE